MGLFSGIKKAAKGILKGVKKVFKGVAKGIGKVWGTTLGKALIIGAVVWAMPHVVAMANTAAVTPAAKTAASLVSGSGAATTGGLASASGEALGLAANTFGTSTAGTSLAAGGGIGATASTSALTAMQGGGGALMAGGQAAGSSVANTLASTAGSGTPVNGMSNAPHIAAGTTENAAVQQATGSMNLFNRARSAVSKTVDYFGDHPVATMMAGQALYGAMQPSAKEVMQDEYDVRQKNSTAYGVKYDGSGPGINLSRLAPKAVA